MFVRRRATTDVGSVAMGFPEVCPNLPVVPVPRFLGCRRCGRSTIPRLKSIDGLEDSAGCYTRACFCVHTSKLATSCLILTLAIRQVEGWLHPGAGIVAEADPESESRASRHRIGKQIAAYDQ